MRDGPGIAEPTIDRPLRISVVGPTGSGKSFLARALAAHWNLPLYELDNFRRAGNTDGPDRGQFIDAVSRIAAGEEWIADGHYRDVRDIIWRRAQLIVWLNYSLRVIALQLFRRFSVKRRHMNGTRLTTRERSEGGHSPSLVHASWAHRLGRFWRTLRERSEYRRLLRSPEYANARIVELRTPEATAEWLGTLSGIRTSELGRADPRGMLVELFGIPGAGKSTVAAAVAQTDGLLTRNDLSESWKRRSRLSKAAYITRPFLDLPYVARALRLSASIPLRNRESIARLLRLMAKRKWLRSQSRVVLLDQGFLQDLWSVLYSAGCDSPDHAALSAFIKSLYSHLNAHIIVVDVHPDIASARLSERSYGRSRFDRLSGSELADSLASAIRLQGCIIEAVKAAGVPLVIVDGSASLGAVTDEIRKLEALANIRGGGDAQAVNCPA